MMNCLRCGYDKFITIPDDDGDLLQCTRCSAMRAAGFFTTPPKRVTKRELPTEDEMVGCARGL